MKKSLSALRIVALSVAALFMLSGCNNGANSVDESPGSVFTPTSSNDSHNHDDHSHDHSDEEHSHDESAEHDHDHSHDEESGEHNHDH